MESSCTSRKLSPNQEAFDELLQGCQKSSATTLVAWLAEMQLPRFQILKWLNEEIIVGSVCPKTIN